MSFIPNRGYHTGVHYRSVECGEDVELQMLPNDTLGKIIIINACLGVSVSFTRYTLCI